MVKSILLVIFVGVDDLVNKEWKDRVKLVFVLYRTFAVLLYENADKGLTAFNNLCSLVLGIVDESKRSKEKLLYMYVRIICLINPYLIFAFLKNMLQSYM